MLIKTVVALLALALTAAGGAIVKNDVPLLDSPGLVKRLLIYLTRNSAQTEPDHVLPELRTRAYPATPDELLARVREVLSGKGWDIVEADTADYTLRAVAVTPWLRFRDDIHVALERAGESTLLNVTSRSRVGRADFGANISHIIVLHEALDAGS